MAYVQVLINFQNYFTDTLSNKFANEVIIVVSFTTPQTLCIGVGAQSTWRKHFCLKIYV